MKKFLVIFIISISLFVTGCTAFSGCSSSSASIREQEQLEKNDTYIPHWVNE